MASETSMFQYSEPVKTGCSVDITGTGVVHQSAFEMEELSCVISVGSMQLHLKGHVSVERTSKTPAWLAQLALQL